MHCALYVFYEANKDDYYLNFCITNSIKWKNLLLSHKIYHIAVFATKILNSIKTKILHLGLFLFLYNKLGNNNIRKE